MGCERPGVSLWTNGSGDCQPPQIGTLLKCSSGLSSLSSKLWLPLRMAKGLQNSLVAVAIYWHRANELLESTKQQVQCLCGIIVLVHHLNRAGK